MLQKQASKRLSKEAGHWWFMSVILATQEAEIRRIVVQTQPVQIVCETLSQKKKNHKKGLVEWLKVLALSSNFITTKKKKKKTLFSSIGVYGSRIQEQFRQAVLAQCLSNEVAVKMSPRTVDL
jgi:hypothetical protein